MLNKILDKFKNIYNKEAFMCYFSPGRVNIIGEHIDYNGGKVLPMAISLGIYAAISFNEDTICHASSNGFLDEKILTFDINNYEKSNDFTDYIKGVIEIFKTKYNKVITNGFDIYLESTLPSSSGLSSSAALELLISHIINDYFNFGLSNIDLVKLSQTAEREYVGVSCGIMDQFACGMGKENKCILLNTETIEYEYIDFVLNNASLYILNTNKPRNLVESKYNERCIECAEALSILQNDLNVANLCSVKESDLISHKSLMKDNVYNRALHAVKEELRVEEACNSLNKGDLVNVGKLLNESHASLRDLYDVTGLHLDTIVSLVQDLPFTLGARMTGAGFGGCCIALFNTNDDSLIKNELNKIAVKYEEITNCKLTYFKACPSDATRRIIL